MILGMGVTELVIILLVVLVIFGPKNLPKIGSAIGKTVKNIREGMDGDDKKDGDKKSDDDEAVEVIEDGEDDDVEDASEGGQYCPKCGAHNDAGAEFCSKCGNKLSSD